MAMLTVLSRTHTAEVDVDAETGNKRINDYEILDELGRGEHGKVKLGRHIGTGQQVAIKIVQRYSKRRRLGKLGNPEDKVKKEVAILKKARHPNVVSLLEVIDDPKRQKVYIVLEYVENGEIIWQTRGRREIVAVEKKRLAREKLGIPDSPTFLEESEQLVKNAQTRRQRRQAALKRQRERVASGLHAWSLEHGAVSDDESVLEASDLHRTLSRATQDKLEVASQPSSSFTSASELDRRFRDPSLAAVEGSMYGPYSTDPQIERRLSTASSNFYQSEPDWLSDDDDLGYVPVLTMPEARGAFRDAVLGLEYLHYQGIIHRDIKPANLLVTASHQVKISDFGVSYLGRPLRDDDEEQVEETDATELDDARELSKTVGTPAFYAPELCYTGSDFEKVLGSVPKITGAIDVWSLGVTLYAMIFGRLPFVGDDEFGLFHIIVHKPVFIPSKRLKAVEIEPPPTSASSHRMPVMNSNKRTEDELVYEDVGEELKDLLLRLLEKDPTKRITLKEIKHHPWVLHGLPDPYAWPEETDPAYQSKGKKIEVSNEEVAQAVAKMSFIQKINSHLNKLFRSSTTKGQSSTSDTPHSTSSSSSAMFGKDSSRLSRRLSLRRDGESRTPKPVREREGEHPLSQSVVPSPEPKDNDDYFGASTAPPMSALTPNTPSKLVQRPEMPTRAASTVSTAGSSRTVRPTIVPPDSSSRRPGPTEPQSSSSTIGSMVEASRKLVQSLSFSDRRERSPVSVRSVEGDAHSQPSVALSDTTATGQMQSLETLRDSSLDTITRTTSRDTARGFVTSSHGRSKSYHEVQGPSSARPPSSSLTQQQHHPGTSSDSAQKEPSRHQMERGQQALEPPTRQTTFLPSAVMVSSSSAEDFTSGMSYCASHPSIPSVISGASSLSGDGYHHAHSVNTGKDIETGMEPSYAQEDVPPLLRTEETVTSQTATDNASGDKVHEAYDCDDEDESSEEECLSFGRPKPCQKDSSKP